MGEVRPAQCEGEDGGGTRDELNEWNRRWRGKVVSGRKLQLEPKIASN
jgi:hypothetical protein